MKAVVITKAGGYDSVRAQDWPDPPPPGQGQVRIAVRAAGANFADTLARVGLYPDAPKLPTVLGYEVAGVVESVGPDVDWLAVGDRIIGATRFGGQAELALAHAADCIPLPAALSFEEGAAFLVSYATAWTAAMIMGGLRRGETLLVHSAGGGTGFAATQVGKAAGARVIGTASPAKHGAVLVNGAKHVFDYHEPDVVDEILRVTDGRGVDVVLDPLGPTSFRTAYRRLLRPGGRLVMYGMSEVQAGERRSRRRALSCLARLPFATVPWWKSAAIFNENKGVFALNMLSWWDQEGSLRRVLEPVGQRLAKGVYKPIVAKAFPFSRAGDAHRYLQEARNIGKVVLVPDRKALLRRSRRTILRQSVAAASA
jgi:NADPH:quinone reductase-like Zn-dependent oxidoreductase